MKAQAEAAEEIKQARREKEKKERRARAEEAVRARKSGDKHRSSHSSRSSRSSRRTWREERENDREEGWDRWNGRTVDREKDRKKLKTKSWEHCEEEEVMEYESGGRKETRSARDKGKERERSLSPNTDDRHRRRSRKKYEDDHEDRRRKRRRSRSESPRRRVLRASTSRRHSPSPRPPLREERKYALDDLLEEGHLAYGDRDKDPPSRNSSYAHEDDSDTHSLANYDERRSRSDSHTVKANKHARSTSSLRRPLLKTPKSRSSSPNTNSRSMSVVSSRSSSLSPGPSPPRNLPSKMDKYFEESYDPRLDVAPLSAVPNVPATGLINNAEFEGWDAMLDLIRLRRQDKEDKKRLERLGIVDKKDKKGKGKVKASTVESASVINGSGGSIFDIEYKKRGTVREWDLGKEGVDLSF